MSDFATYAASFALTSVADGGQSATHVNMPTLWLWHGRSGRCRFAMHASLWNVQLRRPRHEHGSLGASLSYGLSIVYSYTPSCPAIFGGNCTGVLHPGSLVHQPSPFALYCHFHGQSVYSGNESIKRVWDTNLSMSFEGAPPSFTFVLLIQPNHCGAARQTR